MQRAATLWASPTFYTQWRDPPTSSPSMLASTNDHACNNAIRERARRAKQVTRVRTHRAARHGMLASTHANQLRCKSKAVGPSPKPTITVHGMSDNVVAPHLPGRGRWASAGSNRGGEHAQGGARGEGMAAHRPHVPRRMRTLDDCSSRAAQRQLVQRLRPRSQQRRCAASHHHAPGAGAAGQAAAARGRSSSARKQQRASLKRLKLSR